MGYSVIAIVKDKIQLLEINVLKLPTKKDNYERLHLIHDKVTELVKLYKPTEFAIEAPFFGKNVQSMLKLGRAQGGGLKRFRRGESGRDEEFQLFVERGLEHLFLDALLRVRIGAGQHRYANPM